MVVGAIAFWVLGCGGAIAFRVCRLRERSLLGDAG
ncbi:hypothetical protein B6N60_04468 [Richelia sinica FACHB-800]|uniref:Uncharacterized protein n=1 Tax=Richelia sinica FACHB-800 TaxID=1357546 RepID=A0A975TCY5_9NOST|nr:hypothetical protein B6N60_04468 [Richelia sinica FACHB-800]